MDIERANELLDVVRKYSHNLEVAHSLEDDAYLEFIQHVANSGDSKLAPVAKVLLEINKLDFERWYS